MALTDISIRALVHGDKPIKKADEKGLFLLLQPSGGNRSHFINRSNVDHMGGPEAYAEAWIDEMSHTHAWRETASASRQLALF